MTKCIILLLYDIATNDTCDGMCGRFDASRLIDHHTFVTDLAIFDAGAFFFFFINLFLFF